MFCNRLVHPLDLSRKSCFVYSGKDKVPIYRYFFHSLSCCLGSVCTFPWQLCLCSHVGVPMLECVCMCVFVCAVCRCMCVCMLCVYVCACVCVCRCCRYKNTSQYSKLYCHLQKITMFQSCVYY